MDTEIGFLSRLQELPLAGLPLRAPRAEETPVDHRLPVCRFEDDLFERHPQGHRMLTEDEARALLRAVFRACGLEPPELVMVPGFDDPSVGGCADVARHRILIETGFLYAYLVLHEAAHILVPEDRRHGASFVHVLRILYGTCLGIPEEDMRGLMGRHGLPGLAEPAH